MFLASLDGFGPVTGVLVFVVEETTNTELFDGGSIPASPVADARGLVAEDTVLPVTDSGALRRIF